MKSFREMCEILDEIAVGSAFSVPEPKSPFRSPKSLVPDAGEHRIIPVVLHSMVVRHIIMNYTGSSERPARDLLERMVKTDGRDPMLVVYASNVEIESLRRMADDLSDTGDDVFEMCAKSIRKSLEEGSAWYSKKTSEME